MKKLSKGDKPVTIPTAARVLTLIQEQSPISTNALARTFRGGKASRGRDTVICKLTACLKQLVDDGVVMPTVIMEDDETMYWSAV